MQVKDERSEWRCQLVAPSATSVELRVTLTSATGTLLVYSPGYEAEEARFTKQATFGLVQFAEPILCVKALVGPFEFNNLEILPVEYED
jgi:hypothetical protein